MANLTICSNISLPVFEEKKQDHITKRVSKIKKMLDCRELFRDSNDTVAFIGGWPIDTETFNAYRGEILQHFTPRPEFEASVNAFLLHIATGWNPGVGCFSPHEKNLNLAKNFNIFM